MERTLRQRTFYEKIEPYLFLLPFLIFYFFFTFSMLVGTLGLSFFKYDLIKPAQFVGLANYEFLFQDKTFWQGLRNILLFVFGSTIFMLSIPLLLALLVDSKLIRLRAFFRTTFFMPQILAVSIVTTIMTFVFQPYTGLVNNMLKTFGILAQDKEIMWLTSTSLVWLTMVVIQVWWTGGFNVIMYITAMQDIAEDYYEAASIEGANTFQRIWHITLPLLKPTHITLLFLQLIHAFKLFSQVYLITEGGPGGFTRTYIQYIFETSFRKFEIGRGSAASFLLFVIIMIVSLTQTRIANRIGRD